MATAGNTIQNNVAGFKLLWLQTARDNNGEFVKCRMSVIPGGFMPVRHIHPSQSETFEVISGSVKLEYDGNTKILSQGESFTISKGLPHQWWNTSTSEELQMIITMTPAGNWETQMEQVFGIMNSKGKLSFLQIMAMLREYEMYISGPPIVIQKIMSAVLYPVARMMGIKKFYPEYSK